MRHGAVGIGRGPRPRRRQERRIGDDQIGGLDQPSALRAETSNRSASTTANAGLSPLAAIFSRASAAAARVFSSSATRRPGLTIGQSEADGADARADIHDQAARERRRGGGEQDCVGADAMAARRLMQDQAFHRTGGRCLRFRAIRRQSRPPRNRAPGLFGLVVRRRRRGAAGNPRSPPARSCSGRRRNKKTPASRRTRFDGGNQDDVIGAQQFDHGRACKRCRNHSVARKSPATSAGRSPLCRRATKKRLSLSASRHYGRAPKLRGMSHWVWSSFRRKIRRLRSGAARRPRRAGYEPGQPDHSVAAPAPKWR